MTALGERQRFSRAAHAAPESVPVLRYAVVAYARSGGVTAGVLDDVAIAVSEAVTNAVVHAYADRATAGTVTVKACLSHDELAISISDGGDGMRPRPDSPGLGLGLPLMAQLADRMELGQIDGVGTQVRLFFDLMRRQIHE
ncbi:MAG TPA: ATP-binding protein [Solirubrobacteraceae bacterium]|jgi:anti-sigma regulatory factor (Ser/Thr protein kinase)